MFQTNRQPRTGTNISLTSEGHGHLCHLHYRMTGKVFFMSQSTALAPASLFIGLLWSYRAVTRKEYSDFVLSAVFLLLAILLYVRK